ncbi:MAG: hypothetical protein FJY95_11095 [Candidatus Handelsmanbacteria bacterium]|nr:hypothetical protein [Candidatus Handelsmanbacteria bacterium]
MAAKCKRVQRRESSWRLYLLGLLGLGCVVWSAAGLWSMRAPGPPVTGLAVSEAAPAPVEAAGEQSEHGAAYGLLYYPLEVGRYWVYQQADPERGAPVQIERRIERQERRAGQELFFFSDGSLVYLQEGKVFEIGAQGGVNVIPMARDPAPYMYESQGLQIEKQVGTADTTVMAGGRSYEGCLEVITHLRSPQRRAQMSYSSYYAKGVGLVGQEPWPRRAPAVLTVALQDYGVQ